jgi:hypothetical protein
MKCVVTKPPTQFWQNEPTAIAEHLGTARQRVHTRTGVASPGRRACVCCFGKNEPTGIGEHFRDQVS